MTLARRVLKPLANRLPSGVTLQDATQDACLLILTLASQTDRCPPQVAFEAWIVRRARGDLQDQYARKYGDAMAHVLPGAPTERLTYPSAPDERLDFNAAVEELPETWRDTIRLHLAGATQKEISLTIGVSQPYVSQILKKARARLKERLKG